MKIRRVNNQDDKGKRPGARGITRAHADDERLESNGEESYLQDERFISSSAHEK